MKQVVFVALAALFLLGCRRDFSPNNSDYLTIAKSSLRDSLSPGDYAALDFAKASRLRVDSIALYALRVPFINKNPKEDFVFIKTDGAGHIEKGSIVHLVGKASKEMIGKRTRERWDGYFELSSLNRKAVLQSSVVNGYITAYHPQNSFRSALQEPQGEMMPEVTIVYTRTTSSGYYPTNWYLLTSMYANGGGGGGGNNYYGSLSGGDGNIGNGGGGGGGASAPGGGSAAGGGDQVLNVDIEKQDENAAIDIEKFINCLNAIPDAGAACSIEIFADIPVDSDPKKILNLGTRSPGHTFLNIRKSNASQSVSQNIGFYPKSGWKTTLTTAPIEGKFVDNSEHEFNCGFILTVTPEQLKSAIIQMQRSKTYKYDIDNYNCTDWALDVFNAAGGNLQIPLYDIPGNNLSVGTRMPNGVYSKLVEMKKNNDPRAANIDLGYQKGFAGTSTGPCN